VYDQRLIRANRSSRKLPCATSTRKSRFVPAISWKSLLTSRSLPIGNGWASLAAVGSHIGKQLTSFDARNYGLRKLSELVRQQPYLEVQEIVDAAGSVHLQVRCR